MFPASGSPRGCPAHGLATSPIALILPTAPGGRGSPAAAGSGGFWPSCGASGTRFTLSKAIREARDLSAAPGAAGQCRRVACHICHCRSHPPRRGGRQRAPGSRVRGMRQINTRFLCTALRRQAGHTVHSWKHPAASPAAKDAQAAAVHAGQVPGPTRKARRSPQGQPPPCPEHPDAAGGGLSPATHPVGPYSPAAV